MSRIFKRHESWCSKTSQTDFKCKPKPGVKGHGSCTFHIDGVKPNGEVTTPRSLKTRVQQIAEDLLFENDRGISIATGLPLTATRPAVGIKHVADLYLLSKKKLSAERQKKLRNLTDQLEKFADREGKSSIEVLDLPFLIRYVDSWTEANTTQRVKRESLRSFFRFAKKAKFITDNPAEDVEPIPLTTAQTDVFTDEELKAIMDTLPNLADEYGRKGGPIARQTTAFVLMMRHTGMSIGDVAGLPKTHLQGNSPSRACSKASPAPTT